uniref:glutathione binding-like protein n=1 Tax=Mycobacterium tuberculosis TaxID=1773 RepID=UPI00254F2A75
GPWLVGDRYTAADLLCSSPYLWFRDLDAGCERIRDWVERCAAHPARVAAMAWDQRALAA